MDVRHVPRVHIINYNGLYKIIKYRTINRTYCNQVHNKICNNNMQ